MQKHSAFSLVELSIVLVILGLLVGGILAGQSLIHAAALRSVSADYQKYLTARDAFRDKYMALPGDISNATSFWGRDNTRCPTHGGTAATPGTCNGNGNGLIGSSSQTDIEQFRFWQHLSLSGMIDGDYTGYHTAVFGGTPIAVSGVNAPASRFESAAFHIVPISMNYAASSELFYTDAPLAVTPMLVLSQPLYVAINSGTPILSPEDAWNLDVKIDDGRSGSGKYVGGPYPTCTSGDATMANTNYNLASSTARCFFAYRLWQ